MKTILNAARLALALALAPAALADDAAVAREGEGTRRASLNAMERKAFPAGAWSKLSEWQHGDPLTATGAAGKVVVVGTWTDYLPSAKRAMGVATRIAESNRNDVIVVMVHPATEWASANKPKAAEGATLLFAQDAKGEFRSMLKVDQDPDFYVIDRAGQLRFADIPNEAVEQAVAGLVAETPDAAANVNQRLAELAKVRDAEARRSAGLSEKASMIRIPELSFPQPSEEDYEKATWPLRPRDESVQDDPKAQLPALPVTLPETNWLPNKPSLRGKAVLIYIWHPKLGSTIYNILPAVDQVQKQYKRDVVCVGVMQYLDQWQSGGANTLTKDEKDPEKMTAEMQRIFNARNMDHYFAFAGGDTSLLSQAIANSTSGQIPIPTLLILSSDGKCRWWVSEKSRVSWDAALLTIIENDPGIAARRKAEDAWLAAQQKK